MRVLLVTSVVVVSLVLREPMARLLLTQGIPVFVREIITVTVGMKILIIPLIVGLPLVSKRGEKSETIQLLQNINK